MLDWSRIKDKIIEKSREGVQGENLIGGRRAIKLDGTILLKLKTTAKDRKYTL